ncbi:hypothetical protein DFH06DRAFT_1384393 [Mycena polygramma]|nr:hypothetical protein DFH06DRAFT_1384393 [Mycena polygramma]
MSPNLAWEHCSTDELMASAHEIILKYRQQLDTAEAGRYGLFNLVVGMLDCAPTPEGSRYVAISLHTADAKSDGGCSVVEAAKAWLYHLLLPMFYMISRNVSGTILSRQQAKIHKKQLAKREHFYCAITGKFDMDRIKFLQYRGRANETPRTRFGNATMKVARILPLALIDFKDGGQNLDGPTLHNAARTWEMLHAWTRIDPKDLQAARMTSPSNAIYMSQDEHWRFNTWQFYLNKRPGSPPHAYEATSLRGCFTINVLSPTVVFSGIDLPNPEYIAIHAAFAQVLNNSGVVAYVEKLHWKKEKVEENEKADIGQVLAAHLAALPEAILAPYFDC